MATRCTEYTESVDDEIYGLIRVSDQLPNCPCAYGVVTFYLSAHAGKIMF